LIETAHHQQFFAKFLPRLTNIQAEKNSDFTALFLNDLLFKVLG
jgi:hypothetical protein